MLDEILKDDSDTGLPGIKNIPVRNPTLIFQTPTKGGEDNIKTAKNFFKKKSKMRDEGKNKALKWGFDNGLDSAVGLLVEAGSMKKRLKKLMRKGCLFPDYTVGSLYKRKLTDDDWEGGLASFIGPLPTTIPKTYTANLHRKDQGVVCEFICHLGKGAEPPTDIPGINGAYFPGRAKELERLIASRDILRSDSLNLVNFGFLEEVQMV